MLLHESSEGFLGETVNAEKAKYLLLPVPMEMTTSYLKGTRFGPSSVISASRSLENYDYELDYNVSDLIFTLNELELPPDPTKSIDIIKKSVSDIILSNKIPILLGGEHTITYGASLAFEDETIFLVFDAHADMKHDFLGVELNHASTSYLISRKKKIILVGVRSFNLEEKERITKEEIPVFYLKDTEKSNFLSSLKRNIAGKKVYISIDMDIFDPSIAPGVGTPQPNGIQYERFLEMLKAVVNSSKIAGVDITEIRPLPDDNRTEILASKLIIDIVSLDMLKYLK
ncbi:agmatinase [Candidatus Parvarchaeota archaeon]|nr:agmatinase [Candidatus Parvarchaeota archaeon]